VLLLKIIRDFPLAVVFGLCLGGGFLALALGLSHESDVLGFYLFGFGTGMVTLRFIHLASYAADDKGDSEPR
jgi:hypothetical protein